MSKSTNPEPEFLDLAKIRQDLAKDGKRTWRNLEELGDTPAFKDLLEREFPRHAAPWTEAIDRRQFVKLMGASLALAGLAGCRPKVAEKIVPYVRTPEGLLPGTPQMYASAMNLGGYGIGVLVESNTGRPTRIEGNPEHPSSLGATDVFSQAEILNLYDPDRSQGVLNLGTPSSWNQFLKAVRARMNSHMGKQGAGLGFLMPNSSSPTLQSLVGRIRAQFPQARWYRHEPFSDDNVIEGCKRVFGVPCQPVYDFANADVILSLDADFLNEGPGRVRYAKDFSDGRRVRDQKRTMNRLYSVESTHTITGGMADHVLPLRASEIEGFARSIANRLGVALDGGNVTGEGSKWVQTIVDDLKSAGPKALVIAGQQQTAAVHGVVALLNQALGNIGKTVKYVNPICFTQSADFGNLTDLSKAIGTGTIETLIVLGGNPVFTSPGDLNFAAALSKVKFVVHLGASLDETSEFATWHVPETHSLEVWSDIRGHDGSVSVVQPLIEPMFGGKSAIEVLAAIAGVEGSAYSLVQETWKAQMPGQNFDKAWRKILHDGVLPNSAAGPVNASANPTGIGTAGKPGSGLEVSFRPDPTLWDGRFANNGWLQELPKPLSKVTWENIAMISPATASKLGVSQAAGGLGRDTGVPIAEISAGGKSIKVPVWIAPNHANDSITLFTGGGRAKVGAVGANHGYDAFQLLSSANTTFTSGVKFELTGSIVDLATTQIQSAMEGRAFVRSATLQKFVDNPGFAAEEGTAHEIHAPDHEEESGSEHGEKKEVRISVYPDRNLPGNAWGMSIDASTCTGCNACIIACQSENNIPVVGKVEVTRGRAMHWIRIDRYYEGNSLDNPETLHIPVMCMHCEQAPCEVVCPVAATVHSDEGLNEMVYNRCVGTRYCANNCPYKVRRFNYRQYQDTTTPILKLKNNPNVTVRGRGVMEKCTYCVQRINAARKTAKKENRDVKDGEIVTACQAACPAGAIVFGNLRDKESAVHKEKSEPHSYHFLEELNTLPRTTYLGRVRNPNPALEKGA